MRIAFTIEITIPDDTEYVGELQREIMCKTHEATDNVVRRDGTGYVSYWATSESTRKVTDAKV